MEVASKDALMRSEFLQPYISEAVATGFTITKYIKARPADARNVIFYQKTKTVEEAIGDGTQKLPSKVADGASLREIRTSGLNAKAQPVEMRGYKLVVDNDMLKENLEGILDFIAELGYGIGRQIEYDVVSQLKNKALADTATLGNGTWNSSTTVDLDVMAMQSSYKDYSRPNRLDKLFLNDTNLQEARSFVRGKFYQEVPEEPSVQGTQLMDGGLHMTEGYALGFDSRLPPATVYYGTEDGAFNPKLQQGMENFSPLINVKVKNINDEIPGRTEVYMAAKNTVAVTNPKAVLYQSGL